MNKPKEIDAKLIDYISKLGGDLTEHQEVEFFLYFANEFDAVQAEIEIYNLQFHTHLQFIEDTNEWLCLVTKKLKVTTDRLVDIGDWLDIIAIKYGGHYDGWGTMINIKSD